MARDGNGTYVRTDGIHTGPDVFQQEEANAFDIEANLLDAEGQDMADALTQSLSKDGQTTPTNDLPMGGFKHTGSVDATANNQYGTFGQNNTLYPQSVNTFATSTADAIRCDLPVTPSSLVDGQPIIVSLQHGANTITDPTFRLNNFTAKTIVKENNQALVAGDTYGQDAEIILVYSSALDKWVFLNPDSSSGGDAATLNGQNGAFYQNSSNQNAGTLPSGRLSGSYTITASNATLAANSTNLNGQTASFYTNSSNQTSGTLPSGRLTGTYSISVTGNAGTATTASNATQLNGQTASFYTNSSNQTSGTLPTGRLSGTYNMNVSGVNVVFGAGLGSAAATSYGFFADTAKGFYSSNTNEIGVAIAGDELGRFVSDGWQPITGKIRTNQQVQGIYVGEFDSAGSGIRSGLPSGWSMVKNSTGNYTITHGLGHTNYAVQSTAVGGVAAWAKLDTITTTTFKITTINDVGAPANLGASFMLTETQ